jgi:hypothetical protein
MNSLKYIILFLYLTFLGCDKYISYSYESESIASRTQVSGLVFDSLRQVPVKEAVLSFNGIEAVSDNDGYFDIEYILGVDEQRDKPVSIRVTAHNYLTLDIEVVFYPGEKNLLINLEYAAPIIQKIWIGIINNHVEAQVRVLDFQGKENINYVRSKFFYFKMHEQEIKHFTAYMEPVEVDTMPSNSRFFRSTATITISNEWIFEDRQFEIEAFDHDGFSHFVNKKYSNIWVTEPLFDVIPE